MLRVSPSLTLPLDYVTKTGAILAQRRKGKTYTASVIAEEMVKAGMPFAVLDPTGAWWGLRASADGQSAGLPVIVLGGQHADVPLERASGKLVADLVVDEPGWYVIDVSQLGTRAAERDFAADFADRLYRRKGQPGKDFPLHLFVDEADMFVPQSTGPDERKMLGAFEAIVRRGGIRGLGTTLISQRPAVVNKNVLEQLDLLIVLRVVGPNDRAAIDRIVKAHGTEEQRAELMSSLASLDLGEGWFWEPGAEPPLYERVKVRERETFNSSATPKAGERRIEPKVLADVDLAALQTRMAETIERQKQDDPELLRRQLLELRAELRAQGAHREVETVVQTVEVLVPHQPALDALEALYRQADQIAGQVTSLIEGIATLEKKVREVPEPKVTRTGPERAPTGPGAGSSPRGVSSSARNGRSRAGSSQGASSVAPGPAGMPLAERKILVALANYPDGRTKQQLALLTVYAVNGGAFKNALGALRTKGYITPAREEPVRILEPGLDALGPVPPMPTGRELFEQWQGQPQIGKAERLIMDALYDAYPHSMEKPDLAAATGYEADGGAFKNALGRLRTLEIITPARQPIALRPEFYG